MVPNNVIGSDGSSPSNSPFDEYSFLSSSIFIVADSGDNDDEHRDIYRYELMLVTLNDSILNDSNDLVVMMMMMMIIMMMMMIMMMMHQHKS